MGIGIKKFLEIELLSHNAQTVVKDAVEGSAEGNSELTAGLVGHGPRENGGDRRTGRGSDLPKPSRLAPNILAIPPPNKWRGSKIKVDDKGVIQAQEQERSTQNLRKVQSRKEEIRPEQGQSTDGSAISAQADSQEATSIPGNVVDGRHIYKARNALMSYGLSKSGLKRKKKTNAGGRTGPTTPPRPAKPPQSPPKKSPAIKSRAHGSPKKGSPAMIRKRKKSEVDSEGECEKKSKKRSSVVASRGPEEEGRAKKRSD
jgi:hypothetical protein